MAKRAPLFGLTRFFFYSYSSQISLHKMLQVSSIYTHTANNTAPTNRMTFSHIFQECANQRAYNPGKQAHARMIVTGFAPTIFVTNCLLQMYVKCVDLGYAYKLFDQMLERDVVSWNSMIFAHAACGDMGTARMFFEEMPERDVVSWNSLVSGYNRNGECLKSIEVFVEMGRRCLAFDHKTFAVVLKACSALEQYEVGIQVHGLAVRMGFDCDVVTGSALVDMYAKCKRLCESVWLFREIPEKNWVSWSAIIAGCVQNDQFVEGLELFKEMQLAETGVSQSTFASVFRSCAALSVLRLGTQLHAHALKNDFGSDVIVGTATLDMYAKCDSMLDARELFNSLPSHNLQSFNAMIIGYARNDQGLEALLLFQLLVRSVLGFDEVSLSGAFSACALIKGLFEGLQVHGLTVKSNFRSSVCVANAMMDMYGKCGALAEASCVFDEMNTRDVVSWNAIIAAHEQNGNDGYSLSFLVSML
ncbi:pentatricopeptide repeat-containing protein At3g02330, mitochondrial, partial [Carica papaya]|uniref:pentatricopeptide repeat-containing protein At3g02330, mitochondrial n=1 Tax=Carica papaya TaxID=3649 RepID=UPI000B8CE661